MARPIPREAPVIRATLPFREFVIVPIPFDFNEFEIRAVPTSINRSEAEIGAALIAIWEKKIKIRAVPAAIDDMKTNARMGDKISEKP